MLGKRLLILLAAGMLAGLALAGCDSPDSSTPAGAVEVFFDRLRDEDQDGVRALLCQDFRDNVNLDMGKDRDVSYSFDLRYDAPDAVDAATVDVAVYGKMEMHLRSDDVRYEVQERRTAGAPWTVRVARMDGKWLVCGGDERVLALLDARGALDALH